MVSMSLAVMLMVVEYTPLLFVSDGDAAVEADFFSSTLLFLNSLEQYFSELLSFLSIFRSACLTVKDPGENFNAS